MIYLLFPPLLKMVFVLNGMHLFRVLSINTTYFRINFIISVFESAFEIVRLKFDPKLTSHDNLITPRTVCNNHNMLRPSHQLSMPATVFYNAKSIEILSSRSTNELLTRYLPLVVLVEHCRAICIARRDCEHDKKWVREPSLAMSALFWLLVYLCILLLCCCGLCFAIYKIRCIFMHYVFDSNYPKSGCVEFMDCGTGGVCFKEKQSAANREIEDC